MDIDQPQHEYDGLSDRDADLLAVGEFQLEHVAALRTAIAEVQRSVTDARSPGADPRAVRRAEASAMDRVGRIRAGVDRIAEVTDRMRRRCRDDADVGLHGTFARTTATLGARWSDATHELADLVHLVEHGEPARPAPAASGPPAVTTNRPPSAPVAAILRAS